MAQKLVRLSLLLAALCAPALTAASPSSGSSPSDTVALTLADAIDLALRASPAAAQARLTNCEGVTTLAKGINTLLPTLSGSVSYNLSSSDTSSTSDVRHSSFDISSGSWSAGLSLSQVVFSPSAFSGLVTAAVKSSYSSTSARDQTAKLVYDATADYIGLLKTAKLRDVAAAALARSDKYLQQITEKRRLGMLATVDLLRAQVQESQARLDLRTAEGGLAVAEENLKATLGLERRTTVLVAESLAAPMEYEISDPDSLIAEIERTNPGTLLAAKSRTIADVNKVAAVAQVLPSVSLNWSSDYSGSALPKSLKEWQDNDQTSFGLRASLPLLDLKSYVLDIVDAANTSRKARVASQAARLQIRATAADAVIGYQEARDQYDLSRANLELNQKLRDLADEQLKLGSITMVDYLTVDADLVQAQSSLISALCGTYLQAAQLSYLLGRTVLPSQTE